MCPMERLLFGVPGERILRPADLERITMKILVSGLNGHMGQEVAKLCEKGIRGAELYGGVDITAEPGGTFCVPSFEAAGTDCDCIIDFSHHSLSDELCEFAAKYGIPAVIATTGQTEEEMAAIRKASETVPVFYSANMSFGIALLIELAKKAAAAMPDAEIEIIEKHHDRKLDAPSGTALAIAKAIQEVRPEAEVNCGRSGHAKRTPSEIGISSIRMGNIVGEHEVMIGTQNQTITLKHEAHSRALFAEGAIAAAAFLIGKPAGLYSMNDMLK